MQGVYIAAVAATQRLAYLQLPHPSQTTHPSSFPLRLRTSHSSLLVCTTPRYNLRLDPSQIREPTLLALPPLVDGSSLALALRLRRVGFGFVVRHQHVEICLGAGGDVVGGTGAENAGDWVSRAPFSRPNQIQDLNFCFVIVIGVALGS